MRLYIALCAISLLVTVFGAVVQVSVKGTHLQSLLFSYASRIVVEGIDWVVSHACT